MASCSTLHAPTAPHAHMSIPDRHDLLHLDILTHVEQSPQLSNRQIASKLGVSVKLAHSLLAGMVRRGLLHVKVVHARRWDYFLTPRGLAEKARLTLEFVDFSLHFYREARRRSSQVCRELAADRQARVALLGAGDLAEIAYLGLQEWGLHLHAVYDDSPRQFMGLSARPLAELADHPFDIPIIVCVYDGKQPMRQGFLPPGVASQGNYRWIFQ